MKNIMKCRWTLAALTMVGCAPALMAPPVPLAEGRMEFGVGGAGSLLTDTVESTQGGIGYGVIPINERSDLLLTAFVGFDDDGPAADNPFADGSRVPMFGAGMGYRRWLVKTDRVSVGVAAEGGLFYGAVTATVAYRPISPLAFGLGIRTGLPADLVTTIPAFITFRHESLSVGVQILTNPPLTEVGQDWGLTGGLTVGFAPSKRREGTGGLPPAE